MVSNSIHEKRHALRIAVGIFVLMMVLLQGGSVTAIPYEQWNKTFGGTSNYGASSVQQTLDGGYIIAGYDRPSRNSGDAWLMKNDANGNKQWSKTFGYKIFGGEGYDKPLYDEATSVRQTSDGGYILTGNSIYSGGGSSAWLIKTDINGNQQWSKTFGMKYAYSIQQTLDGKYVLAGNAPSDTGSSAWLIKTDANGNTIWEKTFGGQNDGARSVQQTLDGGYIFAGYTWSYGFGYGDDVLLVKTDEYGNEMWHKTLGGKVGGIAYSVQQTSDDGYILAGVTSNTSYRRGDDFWLVKTDANGNKQWGMIFGDKLDDWAFSVQQTSDGGYILAGKKGWRLSGEDGSDAWLVKTDASGNEMWNKTIKGKTVAMAGAVQQTVARAVQQTSDGGYIVLGDTGSDGMLNVWLVKISSEISDTQTPTSTINITPTTTQITTPASIPTSQLKQEVEELKLNRTAEKQNQLETRISWLESKINSLLGWIKSFFI